MLRAMALNASEFAVDDDIRRAETLPAAAFVERDFLARELETVFRRTWQFVPERDSDDRRPLIEQLASRGTRLPFSLLGRPLFFQRGWDDDQLRCFPNTCTHAWFPLVLGPSRGPTLVCGQHGRRFDCEGRFLSQQGFGKETPDFPRPCDHLTSLPVTEWRGHVFANLDPQAPPLAQTMAEVDASVARFPRELTRAAAPGEVRDVPGNWKQHVWNYLDRFHIGFIHRPPGGLADAVDLGSYKTELYSDSVLQWVYASKAEDGFDPAHLPERFADPKGRRVFALWWYVLPNLTLNYYPWGLSVNVYQPVPERPDTTKFLWYHYVLDATKYEQRDRRWLSAQVDAEDIDALAQVERGLRSGMAPRGRFAPTEETGPHWFHRKVYRTAFE
jgi:choline monooxygenase